VTSPFVPTVFNNDAGIGRGDQPALDRGGAVTSLHPQYEDFFPLWRKCRDAIDGEEAVKEERERYLPSMRGMDQLDYDAYLERASFYGATGRTVNGLLGMVFRKEPLHEEPERLAAFVANVTGTGKDLRCFARDVVNEQLAVGRVGVLVDMPPEGGEPFLRLYTAENVTNWRERIERGVPVLDQVILREVIETVPLSGFGSDYAERYRVLEIDAAGSYVQRVFEVSVVDDSATWEEVETIYPTRRGRSLDYIPFVVISAVDLDPGCEKPPLLDLVNVNLSHYRSSADLEHGRHFTALPTPYVTGVDQPEQAEVELFIGAGKAWMLPQGATAGMLEFHGQGLKHLENALSEKQEQMVNLGARMLETSKRASETAESLRLRQSGDASMLALLVETASDGIARALRWAAAWLDADPDEVAFALNDEFFEVRMDPQELNALVKSWQEGAIAFPDLYASMVRGEIVDRARSIDDVRRDIEEDDGRRLAVQETVRQRLADGSPRSATGGLPGVGKGGGQ
jgi:hypothetical protein